MEYPLGSYKDYQRIQTREPVPLVNRLDYIDYIDEKAKDRLWPIPIKVGELEARSPFEWDFERGPLPPDKFASMDTHNYWRWFHNRVTWKSGMLGANPFSVDFHESLAGLTPPPDDGYSGNRHTFEWGSGGTLIKDSDLNWYFNTDWSRIDAMSKSRDAFFDYKTDGWQDTLDNAFPTQRGAKIDADLVREFITQQGIDPKEWGKGAANKNDYLYWVNRFILDHSLETIRKHRYDEQLRFLGRTTETSEVIGDHIFDMGMDWELWAMIPLTLGVGAVGAGIKTGGQALLRGERLTAQLSQFMKAAQKGEYVNPRLISKLTGETIDLASKSGAIVGRGPTGRSLGRILNPRLWGNTGRTKDQWQLVVTRVTRADPTKGRASNILKTGDDIMLSIDDTARLMHSGGLTAVMPTAQKGVWSATFLEGSNLGRLTKTQLGSQKVISSMLGYPMVAVGHTLELAAFMKGGRSLGGMVGRMGVGGGWGAAYGLGMNLRDQEDRIRRQDFIDGVGNHDVTFSLGELGWTMGIMGAFGFALTGFMDGFLGGQLKHWYKDANKLGWTHKGWMKTQMKHIVGMSTDTPLDGTFNGLVSHMGWEEGKLRMATFVDKMTGGEGEDFARFLDKNIVEGHHSTMNEISNLLVDLNRRSMGNVINREVIEQEIMAFLRMKKNNAGGRVATSAERQARNARDGRRAMEERGLVNPISQADSLRNPTPRPRDFHAAAPSDRQANSWWKAYNDSVQKLNNRRARAEKAKDKYGLESDQFRKAFNKFKRTEAELTNWLEKGNKGEAFPLFSEDLAPEIYFENYQYQTEELVKLFDAVEKLKLMENRDTSVNEMIAQHELINKLLKDMDTKYPRRDNKSRKILRDEEDGRLNERIQQETMENSELRKAVLSALLKRMQDPTGNHARASELLDEALKQSKLSSAVSKVAELGSSKADAYYSNLYELRTLGRMLDNTHEFLVDDLHSVGRNQSVWHAKQKAKRDASYVIATYSRAETAVPPEAWPAFNILIAEYRVRRIERGKIDEWLRQALTDELGNIEHLDFEQIATHFRDFAIQLDDYYITNYERGLAVKQLTKQSDPHGYVTLQQSIIQDNPAVTADLGGSAFHIKANSYMETGFVSIVELAALGHVSLATDKGAIVGINGIPKKSIFWTDKIDGPTLAKQVWDHHNDKGFTYDDLRVIQAAADNKRFNSDLPIIKREDTPPHLIAEAPENPLETVMITLEKRMENAESALVRTTSLEPEATLTTDQVRTGSLILWNIRRNYLEAMEKIKKRVPDGPEKEQALAALKDKLNNEIKPREDSFMTQHSLEFIEAVGQRFDPDTMHVSKGDHIMPKDLSQAGAPRVISITEPGIKQHGEVLVLSGNPLKARVKISSKQVEFSEFTEAVGRELEVGSVVIHDTTNPVFEHARIIEDVDHLSTRNIEDMRRSADGYEAEGRTELAAAVREAADNAEAAGRVEIVPEAAPQPPKSSEILALIERGNKSSMLLVESIMHLKEQGIITDLQAVRGLKLLANTWKTDDGLIDFNGWWADVLKNNPKEAAAWAPELFFSTLLEGMRQATKEGLEFENAIALGMKELDIVKDSPNVFKDILEYEAPVRVEAEPQPVAKPVPDELNLVKVEGIDRPIPASELTTVTPFVGREQTTNIGEAFARNLDQPNPLFPEQDFYAVGEKHLFDMVEAIIGRPVGRSELGISELAFQNNGLSMLDLIDFVNSNTLLKQAVAIGDRENFDVSKIVIHLIKKATNEATYYNRQQVLKWVTRNSEVQQNIDFSNWRRIINRKGEASNSDDYLTMVAAYEKAGYHDSEFATWVKQYYPEHNILDDEVNTELFTLYRQEAEIDRKWQELRGTDIDEWQRNAKTWLEEGWVSVSSETMVQDILRDIGILKKRMIDESLNAIMEGKPSQRHTRVAIERVIAQQYPELEIWNGHFTGKENRPSAAWSDDVQGEVNGLKEAVEKEVGWDNLEDIMATDVGKHPLHREVPFDSKDLFTHTEMRGPRRPRREERPDEVSDIPTRDVEENSSVELVQTEETIDRVLDDLPSEQIEKEFTKKEAMKILGISKEEAKKKGKEALNREAKEALAAGKLAIEDIDRRTALLQDELNKLRGLTDETTDSLPLTEEADAIVGMVKKEEVPEVVTEPSYIEPTKTTEGEFFFDIGIFDYSHAKDGDIVVVYDVHGNKRPATIIPGKGGSQRPRVAFVDASGKTIELSNVGLDPMTWSQNINDPAYTMHTARAVNGIRQGAIPDKLSDAELLTSKEALETFLTKMGIPLDAHPSQLKNQQGPVKQATADLAAIKATQIRRLETEAIVPEKPVTLPASKEPTIPEKIGVKEADTTKAELTALLQEEMQIMQEIADVSRGRFYLPEVNEQQVKLEITKYFSMMQEYAELTGDTDFQTMVATRMQVWEKVRNEKAMNLPGILQGSNAPPHIQKRFEGIHPDVDRLKRTLQFYQNQVTLPHKSIQRNARKQIKLIEDYLGWATPITKVQIPKKGKIKNEHWDKLINTKVREIEDQWNYVLAYIKSHSVISRERMEYKRELEKLLGFRNKQRTEYGILNPNHPHIEMISWEIKRLQMIKSLLEGDGSLFGHDHLGKFHLAEAAGLSMHQAKMAGDLGGKGKRLLREKSLAKEVEAIEAKEARLEEDLVDQFFSYTPDGTRQKHMSLGDLVFIRNRQGGGFLKEGKKGRTNRAGLQEWEVEPGMGTIMLEKIHNIIRTDLKAGQTVDKSLVEDIFHELYYLATSRPKTLGRLWYLNDRQFKTSVSEKFTDKAGNPKKLVDLTYDELLGEFDLAAAGGFVDSIALHRASREMFSHKLVRGKDGKWTKVRRLKRDGDALGVETKSDVPLGRFMYAVAAGYKESFTKRKRTSEIGRGKLEDITPEMAEQVGAVATDRTSLVAKIDRPEDFSVREEQEGLVNTMLWEYFDPKAKGIGEPERAERRAIQLLVKTIREMDSNPRIWDKEKNIWVDNPKSFFKFYRTDVELRRAELTGKQELDVDKIVAFHEDFIARQLSESGEIDAVGYFAVDNRPLKNRERFTIESKVDKRTGVSTPAHPKEQRRVLKANIIRWVERIRAAIAETELRHERMYLPSRRKSVSMESLLGENIKWKGVRVKEPVAQIVPLTLTVHGQIPEPKPVATLGQLAEQLLLPYRAETTSGATKGRRKKFKTELVYKNINAIERDLTRRIEGTYKSLDELINSVADSPEQIRAKIMKDEAKTIAQKKAAGKTYTPMTTEQIDVMVDETFISHLQELIRSSRIQDTEAWLQNHYKQFAKHYTMFIEGARRFVKNPFDSLLKELNSIDKQLAEPQIRKIANEASFVNKINWFSRNYAGDKRIPNLRKEIKTYNYYRRNVLMYKRRIVTRMLNKLEQFTDQPLYIPARPLLFEPKNNLEKNIIEWFRIHPENATFTKADFINYFGPSIETAISAYTKDASRARAFSLLSDFDPDPNAVSLRVFEDKPAFDPKAISRFVPSTLKDEMNLNIGSYQDRLFKHLKKTGFIEYDKSARGWKLTVRGRERAEEMKPIGIERVETQPVVKPLTIDEQIAYLESKKQETVIAAGKRRMVTIDPQTRTRLYNEAKAELSAYLSQPLPRIFDSRRERYLKAQIEKYDKGMEPWDHTQGEWRLDSPELVIAEYNARISELRQQKVEPVVVEGLDLIKELQTIKQEMWDIENLHKSLPPEEQWPDYPMTIEGEAFDVRFSQMQRERTEKIRQLYHDSITAYQELKNREAAIINKLKEKLGPNLREDLSKAEPLISKSAADISVIREPNVFKPASRKIQMFSPEELRTSARTIAPTAIPAKMVKPDILNTFKEDNLNPEYSGATDPLSIADKVDAAYGGSTKHYVDVDGNKVNPEKTALQEAMLTWAKRRNHQAAGSKAGQEVAGAERRYINEIGQPNMGSKERVFSAKELADNPDFLRKFDWNWRQIIMDYANTTATRINAQETLNHWLKSLGVHSPYGEQLKNIRFEDLFSLMRDKVANLVELETPKGVKVIDSKQRRALEQTVDFMEMLYKEMIGTPVYHADAKFDGMVKAVNNIAQSVFGTGISQAVALVELPYAIIVRSGNAGALVNALATVVKGIPKASSNLGTNLEGTAFMFDNIERSGLAKFMQDDRVEYDMRWTKRIRALWKLMWSKDRKYSATDGGMTKLNNFLEGTAKMQSEWTFLRQVINLTKNVAVGNAKYQTLHNLDNLAAFSKAFDPKVFRSKLSAADKRKYIKGLARENKLDYGMAMRWLRAGLVVDDSGLDLMPVVRRLLKWGDATDNNWDQALMFERLNSVDYQFGTLERDLYTDVFDRFINYIEMHAHDASPEPRGIAAFSHFNKNWFGRLFSFYATYPLAFFNVYMKKNPSEVGAIKALALLLAIVGLETMHMQVRELQRGKKSPQEIAEDWKEHPMAKLFQHGSNAPILGYGSKLFREIAVLPVANPMLGEPVYGGNPMNVPATGVFKMFSNAITGAVQGDVLTRNRTAATSSIDMMDWLSTAGNLQHGEKDAQASHAMDLLYQTFFPSKAFWWVPINDALFNHIRPDERDNARILALAYSSMMQEDMDNNRPDAAARLWNEAILANFSEHIPNRRSPKIPMNTPTTTPEERMEFQKTVAPPGTPPKKVRPILTPHLDMKKDADTFESLYEFPSFLQLPNSFFESGGIAP